MRIETTPHGHWHVKDVPTAEAEAFLKLHAPWRIGLKIGGLNSADFGTTQPYSDVPLRKLLEIMKHVPETAFRNGRVLDVGFNMGYNSLYLADNFGAQVTGIDVVPSHKEKADGLAALIGVKPDFRMASAEEFVMENTFDACLHLGTLYHLANPARSIENMGKSLKSGGWLALETICFRKGLPADCRWIYGFNGDKTNFWALGEQALREMAALAGIPSFKVIFEVSPAVYNGEMSRVIMVGQKA